MCKDTPLKTVLKEITKQTGYTFVYSNALKEVSGKIDLSYSTNNAPISKVLEAIFSKKEISYKIDGTQIILAPKGVAPTLATDKETVVISGMIVDDLGDPLPGVTVKNKATGKFVASEITGKYFIEAKEGDVLSFASIGMAEYESAVGKGAVLNVSLKPDAIALQDVVVTGYQTISKERATGSFAKVERKTLELVRNNDLKSMLEGQVAGYTNGQIRGITTMNAISQPMVVIDGFPVENTTFDKKGIVENMPDLNPEDIENITFLKDAAAASIYGARAANGVIVITTRKAKEGKTEIEASATLTVTPYKYYNGYNTNSADIVDMQREWARGNADLNAGGIAAITKADQIRNDGAYPSAGVDALLKLYTGEITQSQADAILNNLASKGYKYTDQVKEYTKRNPFYQQYNIRLGKTTNKNT
ncbi:MAG: TonB-dependent receptor plug domain-containing protein, partial [Bacteroidales bacterium]